MNFFQSLTIVMCSALVAYGAIFPSDIKKCKLGDDPCVGNKIMELFQKYPHGNPEFGLLNVSALTLQNVTVSRATGNSPIQLNFRFLDLVAHGIENTTVKSITGFVKDINIVEGQAVVPTMKILGNYETNGKILFLSLDGKGKGVFELTDCLVKIKSKVHLEKRDGKSYVKIDKLKAIMEPKRLHVKLQNLVKANQELTDTINAVVNENWRDVWTELQDGINETVTRIILKLMLDVVADFPYDDFYDNSDS